MNMKKIKILGLAVLLFSMTACEDWLDVDASNQVDRNELFNSELGYAEALTGVYAKMCDGSLYGRELTFDILDIMAGYYTRFSGNNGLWATYSYADKEDAWSQSFCNPYIERMWNGLYAQIANLNSLLSTIDDHEDVFSGDNYNLLKGEALGLRAFLHFDLLRGYAPSYKMGKDEPAIPYVREVTNSPVVQSTVAEVLEYILTDLKTAQALLKPVDPIGPSFAEYNDKLEYGMDEYITDDGFWLYRKSRLNYYGVTALMARVYLCQ